MTDLAETTEALKRNFLFRGFFNRRGYFDLDDVSVDAVPAGGVARPRTAACSGSGWAAVLFERDANGARAAERRRARCGSTRRCRSFSAIPQNESVRRRGLRPGATGDVRYLLSRRRAQLVRDYLVGKFGLDPNYVAHDGDGSGAHGRPSETDGMASRWQCSSRLRQCASRRQRGRIDGLSVSR